MSFNIFGCAGYPMFGCITQRTGFGWLDAEFVVARWNAVPEKVIFHAQIV